MAYKENYSNMDGVWRTIGGRRVFIKKGQSLSEAMRESGKFKSIKNGNKKTMTKEEIQELKEKQFEIIQKHNPMTDDYHVGIRKVEDIKTFEEVIETADEDEEFVWGDYSLEDANRDLENGFVTVYSSHDIKQGTFVSTSKNQAKEYAGGKPVKSLRVPIEDVAWINGDEGQYAKVKK